jgi:hypothetical protein
LRLSIVVRDGVRSYAVRERLPPIEFGAFRVDHGVAIGPTVKMPEKEKGNSDPCDIGTSSGPGGEPVLET